MIARYRALFSAPGVGRLLVSSVVGRLPSGMFSLAILLFVHGRTGSFLAAGVAVGAFSLAGALIGPLLGAQVDRHGQTRVLLGAALAQAGLLVALVLLTQAGAPVAATVVLAALAGGALPPIGGCVRALWSEVARGEELQTAYALDATTQETIWTLGPLLVGLTAGFVSPAAGVLLCAALTVCGTIYFATSTLSRGWRAERLERRRGSALGAGPNLRLLLYTVVLAGVVIGAVDVGLPALAVGQGARWSSGPLLALFSLGSMAGGLIYSARSWPLAIARRYSAILMAMAIAVAPLIAVHSLAPAFALSVLAGLCLAPTISCQFSLVGALAPEGTVTEAFTWHRAATVAGMAGGSALGGSLIDGHGVGAAFALGCVGVAAAAALAMVGRRRIEPAVAPPVTVDVQPVLESPAALRPEQSAALVAATGEPVPFTLAAEAMALAAKAVALAGEAPLTSAFEQPAPFKLAAEAVALAAEAVASAA
ncbi:MAG TPA: MFS transporter [Solirubrobacteraceae bacterium]|jgi:MFS family permease|nr:MFS transporter [Solirubrobacteraceae bacterium]